MSITTAVTQIVGRSQKATAVATQRDAPQPVGAVFQREHWLWNEAGLSREGFRYAFRGLVAMLLRYRAKHIAPPLLDLTAERRLGPDESEPVEEDHPWTQLLARPNSDLSPFELWKWAVMNVDAAGHADFLVRRSRLDAVGTGEAFGGEVPSALVPLYPAWGRLVPVYDGWGAEQAWVLHRSDGQQFGVEPESVLRIKRGHPVSPARTAGLIEAAAFEIQQDRAANVFARDSLQAQGLPDVMLEVEEEYDRETVNQLASDFASMFQAAGRAKHGVVPASHGGMRIKQMQLSKSDEEFMAQRQFLRDTLFYLFEVHQGLFAQNSTEANAKQAPRSFEMQTVQPEVDAYAAKLGHALERLFDADRGALFISAPNVVSVDEEQQASIDKTRIESGVRTRNEVRRRDGHEDLDGGDVPLVKATLVPAPSSQNGSEDDEDDRATHGRAHQRELAQGDGKDDRDTDEGGRRAGVVLSARQLTADDIDPARTEAEAQLREELMAVLMAHGGRVSEALQDAETAEDALTLASGVIVGDALEDAVRDSYARLVAQFGAAQADVLAEELGEELSDVDWGDVAAGLAAEVEATGIFSQMKSTTRTDAVGVAVALAEELEDEVEELGEELSRQFIPAIRARVGNRVGGTAANPGVAGTEAGRAMNRGIEAATESAAEDVGAAPEYTWTSRRDSRVRATHMAADGQTRTDGETFTVGGETCRYPCDPQLSAKESANCRCYLTADVVTDSEDDE